MATLIYVVTDKAGYPEGLGISNIEAWKDAFERFRRIHEDTTDLNLWKDAMTYRGWKCFRVQRVDPKDGFPSHPSTDI